MVRYSITIVYPQQTIHQTVDLPYGETPLDTVNKILSRESRFSRKEILGISITKMFDCED